MAKFLVTSEEWYQRLFDAAAITIEPKYVRRAILDLEVGVPARIYVETYADDEKFRVGLDAALTVETQSAIIAGVEGADAA